MKLIKLNIALKDGVDTSLSLDNVDSKSHYFSFVNINSVTISLKFVERWITHLSR